MTKNVNIGFEPVPTLQRPARTKGARVAHILKILGKFKKFMLNEKYMDFLLY